MSAGGFASMFHRFSTGNILVGDRGGQQEDFRASVVKAYSALQLGSDQKYHTPLFWCPITQLWLEGSITKAGHIFEYNCGIELMKDLFHTEGMFSPGNGMLLHSVVESMYDKMAFTIVPFTEKSDGSSGPVNLEDDEAVDIWRTSKVKDYCVKILTPSNRRLTTPVTAGSHSIKDMDGKRLLFTPPGAASIVTTRPRARYLHYRYIVGMMKLATHQSTRAEPVGLIRDGYNGRIWGTRRRFLDNSVLRCVLS